MDIRPLAISGAFEVTPRQHGDDRGRFLEWFKAAPFEDGSRLHLRMNPFVSAAGVVRGIHFSDVPPGQAKYVTCVAGAVIDIVVDIRVGSPTFGTWDSVVLDGAERRVSTSAKALVMHSCPWPRVRPSCTSVQPPTHLSERGIHPLDPELGIAWPTHDRTGRQVDPILSEKDASVAPQLGRAASVGLLPAFETVRTFVTTLR